MRIAAKKPSNSAVSLKVQGSSTPAVRGNEAIITRVFIKSEW